MLDRVRIAIALDENDCPIKSHFGDAVKYHIYEIDFENNSVKFDKELINEFLEEEDHDDHHEHSAGKGKKVTKLFLKHDVKLIASRQFGLNIKIVRKKFIPVHLIHELDLENILQMILSKKAEIIAAIGSETEDLPVINI